MDAHVKEGAPEVKEKIYSPSLNSNSKFNSSMFKSNTYIHLPIENFGFRYHDKSRVVMHDNCKKKWITLPWKGQTKRNLGKLLKKSRHMLRNRSRNVQGGQNNSRTRKLELENQALRAKVVHLEKTLKKMTMVLRT